MRDMYGNGIPIHVFILGGLLLLVAVFAFTGWYYSADQRTKRALRQTRRSAIGKVGGGELVKVAGTLALQSPPLTAPLSGRQCAYYEVIVEEWRSRGRSGRWREIIHETEGRDFLLEDPTGRALISLADCQVAVTKDATFKSGIVGRTDPQLESFLQRRGRSSHGFLFDKIIRYKEGVLEPGEEVAVLGYGTWAPDPELPSTGYRQEARRLIIVAPAGNKLQVSDDPSTI